MSLECTHLTIQPAGRSDPCKRISLPNTSSHLSHTQQVERGPTKISVKQLNLTLYPIPGKEQFYKHHSTSLG